MPWWQGENGFGAGQFVAIVNSKSFEMVSRRGPQYPVPDAHCGNTLRGVLVIDFMRISGLELARLANRGPFVKLPLRGLALE